jgi:hypothetical protein
LEFLLSAFFVREETSHEPLHHSIAIEEGFLTLRTVNHSLVPNQFRHCLISNLHKQEQMHVFVFVCIFINFKTSPLCC